MEPLNESFFPEEDKSFGLLLITKKNYCLRAQNFPRHLFTIYKNLQLKQYPIFIHIYASQSTFLQNKFCERIILKRELVSGFLCGIDYLKQFESFFDLNVGL